jgi:alkylation response protein AidB-like acyl-CoA dehydrogenase
MSELVRFRAEAAAFIAAAVADGTACPAFGAILPPSLHDRARGWQRTMHKGGFAGIHWPTEFGGRGLSRAHSGVWAEECARADVSQYLNLQSIVLAGEAIARSGTDEQRKRFLPGTASGELLWCQMFSEPDAGSDLAGLKATAVAAGDDPANGWTLNGQKVWCSNGQFAEFGILMARTGDAGHRGISFFLLDMSLPGIDVRPLRQITGEPEFTEIFFHDVHLPADSLLGPLHGGWGVAMNVLTDERGSSDASGLIGLDRRLAQLAALMGDDPVRRDELMNVLVRGHALRAMLLRGDRNPAAASAAKLMRTELEFAATGLSTALRGADAMLAGPATDAFLYSPGMKIAGGSSEIQRNIIGERILGLPR